MPAAAAEEGQGTDPNQTMDAYVHPRIIEPSYIYGPLPGVGPRERVACAQTTYADTRRQPYVAEHSHNMFARLGARIAFLGIDARTEVRLLPDCPLRLAIWSDSRNSVRDIRSTTRRPTRPSSPVWSRSSPTRPAPAGRSGT